LNSEVKARLASLSAAQRAELLERLRGSRGDQVSELPTTYPLYDMQRVIWAAQSLAPSSTAYNVGFLFELSAPYRLTLLRNAVASLVARHRVLRSVFRVTEAGPTQTVLAEMSALLEDIDASALEPDVLDQHVRAAYERPFDLNRGPVWRLTQFRRNQGDAFLLIVGHHLALDLWSINVLMDDLRVAYEAERTGQTARFEAPTADYSKFITEQRSSLRSAEHDAGWRFWSEQLSGIPPAIDLPTDRPRRALPTYRGSSYCFTLSAETTAALTEFAKREGKTLYATLLAAWSLLLQKYGGASDLVVGTPVSNRSGAFARTVGCAINFLPLRVRIAESENFSELLDRVFQTVLTSLTHQDFPFGVLTSRLNLPRDRGRSALTQLGFCLEGSQLQGHAVGNTEPKATPLMFLAQQEGQVELYLEMAERLGVLHGALRYDTDIFDHETAERLITGFQSLLASILEAPTQAVGGFSVSEFAGRQRDADRLQPLNRSELADAHSQALRALWKQRCAQRTRVPSSIHGGTERE
jgi:hypothetical protein